MTPLDMALTHAAAFTQGRPWSEAEFAALLDSPANFVTGDSRCFALVGVVADEAELLTIATHPQNQHQGLARDCMEKWQTEAMNRGATQAFLEVASDNTPAISLYKSTGFEQIGLRKGYYQRKTGEPADALVMRRSLT